MKITIEIDTHAEMDETDLAVLAVLGGGKNTLALLSGGATAPLAFAASDAEQELGTSAGAPPATATTSETKPRGRGAAKKQEAAASTPASETSPGAVFGGATASAQTPANPGLTGDVFSQQVHAAVAATEPAPAASGASKEAVHARVSTLLPTLGAKGLKEVLGKFTKSDGAAVGVLRELEEKDFAAFLEELSVYG